KLKPSRHSERSEESGGYLGDHCRQLTDSSGYALQSDDCLLGLSDQISGNYNISILLSQFKQLQVFLHFI
ncbi:MAG: hypothetical protein KAI29_19820, partial [Cyclobacteriaceae bacterium]|nr:hypothetical protein [Cyclobacteriaceae bacterium]